MTKRNSENERIKRHFLQHLRRARGKSEKTVLDSAAAIDRFLEANGHKPLKKFHRRQAIAFCERFEVETNDDGELLSRVTVTKTLKALIELFRWLSEQPGYKSRISATDADISRHRVMRLRWRARRAHSLCPPLTRFMKSLPQCPPPPL